MKRRSLQAYFRVDASEVIGTGHFRRCLTLAQHLFAEGVEITFLCHHLPRYLQQKVHAAGMTIANIDPPAGPGAGDQLAHSHWLGSSQEDDALACLQVLEQAGGPGPFQQRWMVVDHYALDFRWERKIGAHVDKILAIDDLADRVHACDLLLDQNYYPDMEGRYRAYTTSATVLLLGPRFALLREAFERYHRQILPGQGKVRRVLVFFGGIDQHNCTALAVSALALLDAGLQVDVVIGAGHAHRRTLEKQCARHGFTCYVETDRMAELMAAADLAIGAAGSASWERCCLGLPTLLLTLAPNQYAVAAALQHIGVCRYLGRAETVTPDELGSHIQELINKPDQVWQMSRAAYDLVDGQGTQRVSAQLFRS